MGRATMIANSSSSAHAAAPNSSSSSSPPPHKLKCIVLGGAAAGKTSLLRRYFHQTFDPSRVPTMGSDFYTRKLPPQPQPQPQPKDSTSATTTTSTSTTTSMPLSMQVWDTPGRVRFTAHHKPLYTAAFSDNFFKNADAALLVYDMTSSTSFSHVLKWHADLMDRIRRLESMTTRQRPFPVLIVGTKLDIIRQRDTSPSRQRTVVVPQRPVMGVVDTFKGYDSRYEYSAASARVASTSSTSSMLLAKDKNSATTTTTSKKKSSNRFEILTYMGTGEKTNYLEAVLTNDEMKGSYLESLLSTEDTSHPDKDMVLLWCMRNGLRHFEVSAKDGTGIDELMTEMIRMALDSAQNTLPTTTSTTTTTSATILSPEALLKRNDELDLLGRYGQKGRAWWCWCLVPFFQSCCKP